MRPALRHEFKSDNPEATTEFARKLAPRLVRGDCLLLSGPIGAGKSQFARALIEERLGAVGRKELIPSPTYTLVQVYDVGDVEIWHVDLYRLCGPEDAVELGLFDAFRDAICLVEWPDRLRDTIPQDALQIEFVVGETDLERFVTLSSTDARWIEIVAGLAPQGALM